MILSPHPARFRQPGDRVGAKPRDSGSPPWRRRLAPTSIGLWSGCVVTHSGWQDNQGAYGDFLFDVVERTITLNCNERIETSEYTQHVY